MQFNRHGPGGVLLLGDLNVAVDVNRSEGFQGLLCGRHAVHVEGHAVPEHAEVKFMPLLVLVFLEHGLGPLEFEGLELAVEGEDGELDVLGPRIECDGELRVPLDVADANNVPAVSRRTPRPVGADERELLWQPQGENVSSGDFQVRVSLQAVRRLHLVGALDTGDAIVQALL